LALTPEAASWAVETWAIALGVLAADGSPAGTTTSVVAVDQPARAAVRTGLVPWPVLAWTVGVAALWALVGGSAAALVASWLGTAAAHANWIAAGALAGAALGAFAGALVRTVGGAAADLVGWAVGGTVGGATLGALAGAAAGGVAGVALEGPSAATHRAAQWAAAGATAGGLLATVLGLS